MNPLYKSHMLTFNTQHAKCYEKQMHGVWFSTSLYDNLPGIICLQMSYQPAITEGSVNTLGLLFQPFTWPWIPTQHSALHFSMTKCWTSIWVWKSFKTLYSHTLNWGQGTISLYRCCLTSIEIPIIKIRWSHDCVIFFYNQNLHT